MSEQMSEQMIAERLHEALEMRPPTFPPDTMTVTKIGALEDYLLASAFMAAELEEALHWLGETVARCQQTIEQMTGYEVALPRKAQDRISQADIVAAKRTTQPAVFHEGAAAKHLRESVLRQIERLRFEAQFVISRAYTMISGA